MNKYKKNFLILFDQSIVSLGNFLITILLIKYLGIQEFGIFSFFWIFLMLVNSIQLSSIISPMLSNAPKLNQRNIRYYYGGVLLQQIILSIALFITVFIFLKFFFNIYFAYDVETLCLPFSLILISSQLFQFCRRFLINKNSLILVNISDFVVYFTILFIFYYFKNYYFLNLEIILWSLFIVFILGSILLFPTFFYASFTVTGLLISIKDNWTIGKWLLLTSLVQWFSGNLWVLNAGVILGPYYLGIIRACQTIIGIANPFFQSFENIYPKEVSKILVTKGKIAMSNYLRNNSIKIFLLIIFFSLILILFSKKILLILYGKEMATFFKILIYLSFTMPITALMYFPQYGLRSISKTKPIFLGYLTSSFFALVLSNIIIQKLGLSGFIFGIYFSQFVILFIIYTSYKHFLNKY